MSVQEIQGFPGPKGRWRRVEAARLSDPPYAQICEIRARDENRIVGRGTGWLGPDGVIVTAAHLFWKDSLRATYCEVRWANSSDWQTTSQFTPHASYLPGNGQPRAGSAEDLAKVLGIADVPSSRLAPSSRTPQEVAAVGFNFGVLVEHSGPTRLASPFLGHDADTDHGHSGWPTATSSERTWGSPAIPSDTCLTRARPLAPSIARCTWRVRRSNFCCRRESGGSEMRRLAILAASMVVLAGCSHTAGTSGPPFTPDRSRLVYGTQTSFGPCRDGVESALGAAVASAVIAQGVDRIGSAIRAAGTAETTQRWLAENSLRTIR